MQPCLGVMKVGAERAATELADADVDVMAYACLEVIMADSYRRDHVVSDGPGQTFAKRCGDEAHFA
ncbi:Maleate isomerase [Mycobacterium simulans]|nr:Maleate isomerase [Mycobacterium simulans]